MHYLTSSSGYGRSNIFQGLEAQCKYRYRLRASNSHGNSEWSQVVEVSTTRKFSFSITYYRKFITKRSHLSHIRGNLLIQIGYYDSLLTCKVAKKI